MSTFLFEKEVDQSLLKSGLTIPVDAQETIQDAVGVHLSKGQKADISVIINGKSYTAALTNVNLDEQKSSRIVFQIRYSEKSPICKKLNELFKIKASDTAKSFIEVYANSDKALEFRPKSAKKCDWLEFYCEFATKLLDFKNDRINLIGRLQNLYASINLSFPTLEQDGAPDDVDPFTVFGFFNKGLTEAKRKKIIRALKDEFSIQASVPTGFDGIPVLNNINANFFSFRPWRGEKDIDHLWDVFETAIVLADSDSATNQQNFIKAYDTVLIQKGVRWNITMGLFWIRANYYINLDSKNREFLSTIGNISDDVVSIINGLKDIPNGETYLSICDKCREALTTGNYPYKSFPELSCYAWDYSNEKDPPDDGKGNNQIDNDVKTTRYWLYSPGDGASFWDEYYQEGIMAIGWGKIGDLCQYISKAEMKDAMKEHLDPTLPYTMAAHATWQFVHDMKPGDIVFAKKGRTTVIGRGVVVSDYIYDENRDEYRNIRKVKWTHKGEWPHPGMAAMKVLTDITPYTEYVAKMNDLFLEEVEDEKEDPPEISYPPYTAGDFLTDVFMDEDSYDTLVGLVQNKKNVILQGAPGVGKTFTAKRLAYSMMGVKDPNRVMMIQFHQSYSYEDFIMGFRPSGSGFELRRGAFYNFCKAAEIDSDNEYFFIIDEINRGNLSKIFGELFMLIENDKRGIELQLLYSDEKFSVPSNVYIIGMMNTADRSLAMLDYALRRRFAFFDLKPGFDSEGFRQYRAHLNSSKFDNLIQCVEKLNSAIAADESLGSGFCIGHSYFCNLKEATDQALKWIIEYEIIPLLKEYWFDEPMKVEDWSANLRNSIK